MKEILLISPRGFCAGVERAVEILNTALKLSDGEPIYVNHEIVHNKHVVESFTNRGVIFVDNINEVPEGKTIVFSAHGVSPKAYDDAKNRNLDVIDATCPLVTKVHLEARRYAKEKYTIALIGHKNHVEAIGTFGEAPEQTIIIESIDDIQQLESRDTSKIAYLTQTTLSIMDTEQIILALKEKYPHIESPPSSDICYATTNRQTAVKTAAEAADLMIVVGSKNSSNSNRLKELSESLGTQSVLIDSAEFFDDNLITAGVSKIAVTAGASAPEKLVQDLVSYLSAKHGFDAVTEINTTTEDVVFKLPKKLREAAAQKN